MRNIILFFALAFMVGKSNAGVGVDVVCSYAPTQSKAVEALSASTGGAAAGATIVANAAGLTAVTHSSGALIFTGTSGYVAGTLGTAALLPITVTVGTIAALSAGAIELVCAPKNHPELVDKVHEMASKFVTHKAE